ncbi:MAG: peptidylprolyl isomerase [Patescibacteria group bacterium]
MLKKIFLVLILPILSLSLAGCGPQDNLQLAASEDSAAVQDAAADQPAEAGLETAVPNQQINLEKNNMTAINQPSMTINQAKVYTAAIQTDAGEIEITLNAKATPITVNNFVALARQGFYNDTIFHRVIKGFMIQGGDPRGDGTGGPGYSFADEAFSGEYERGTIAMANAGPNTNGSQFFIMHADYPLPKNYVIFGRVVKGLEAVDKIATASVTRSPSGEMSQPLDPVKIKSIEIIER